MKKKKRILVGKIGLDGHDNGVRIVSKWLADAGFEVIYLGLYNTPEGMVKAVLQENADLIGCSFLGGEHLFYCRRLLDLLRQNGLEDKKLIVGGVVPPDDVKALKEMGVSAIFTPGTMRDSILRKVNELMSA
ncbi:MAG: methylmalonyl-CoA mutase [Deltaproteobacteria bacterium]|nr:methylmalonyl-CoA mutase [Deltaproteobacteria bacterium]